jgi:hypothetical protein
MLPAIFARSGRRQATSLQAYFPLRAGASWRYHYGPVEQLRQTLAPGLEPNVQRMGIGSVYLDGKRYEGLLSEAGCEAFEITESQASVRGGADAEGRVALTLFSAPAVVGTRWRSGSDPGGHGEGRIAGTDKVDTPAGCFDCLRVETTSGAGSMTVCWYAPGVGLVQQYNSADDHMLLLHSFFIPPDDLTASLEVEISGSGSPELMLGSNRTGLFGSSRLHGLVIGNHEVGAARGDFQIIRWCSVGEPGPDARVLLEVPDAEEVRPGGLRPFVNRIATHGDGSLWFCTHGYGVRVHQPGRWLDDWWSLNPHNSTVDDYVTDVVFPAGNRALFGTRGRGIIAMERSQNRMDYRPFFGSEESGALAFITALKMHEGRLYVATEDQGLLACSTEGAPECEVVMQEEVVHCLVELREGLFIGAEKGAWLLRKDGLRRIDALGDLTVLAAYQEPAGRILVGMRNGGLKAVSLDATIEAVDVQNLIDPQDSVFDISADDRLNLYICTSRGVCQMPPSGYAHRFEIRDAEGALCARRVGSDLWIAARPGLWRLCWQEDPRMNPSTR